MTIPSSDRPPSSPRLSAAQRHTLTRVGYRIGVQAAIDALTRRDIGDRLAHARATETDRDAAHHTQRPAAAYRRARRDVTRESDLDSDRLLRAAIRAGIASDVSAAATAHYNAEGTGEAMHAWTTAIAHADAWNSVLEDAGIDLDELHEELDLDAQADAVAGVRPGTDVTTSELASPGSLNLSAPAADADHGRSLPTPAVDHAIHIDQEVSL